MSNMADIDIDIGDSQDDGGIDSEFDLDPSSPDEGLTPLEKLERCVDSENIFTRQMVARSLLDTLRSVGDCQEEAYTVLKAMIRLSEDPEPSVRSELMEQLPHLAMYCQENQNLCPDAVSAYLLPTVVRYLTDSNNQVRKTSQAALLVLLEQELVEAGDVEEQVCPVILDLSGPDSMDDFRTEAVALMSKMAPLVGSDITVRLFLPRFCAMCTDMLFHVRKVCAANFGDMCSVVGQDNTEEYLLPNFYYLCEDGVWGVRKACAECFMAVSCSCSLAVRRKELASLFVSLICDQSRWVRVAAFQALGGFISTFADPSATGLYFNEDGILVAGNPEDFQIKGEMEEPESREQEKPASSILTYTDETSVSAPNSNCCDQSQDKEETSQGSAGSDTETVAMEIVKDIEEDVDDDPEISFKSGALSTGKDNSGEPSKELSIEERLAVRYMQKSVQTQGNATDDVFTTTETISEGVSDSEQSSETKSMQNPPVKAVSAGTETTSSVAEDYCTDKQSLVRPAEQDSDPSMSSTPNPSEGKEVKKSRHIPLENIAAFNSFQYWREPLPEVDVNVDVNLVEIEKSLNRQLLRLDVDESAKTNTAKSGEAAQEVHSASGGLKHVQRELELVDLEEQKGDYEHPQDHSLSEAQDETEEEKQERIHMASVSEMKETAEMVANIGSTHVLGQHLNETTMAIVNGVVQELQGDGTNKRKQMEAREGDSNELLSLRVQDVIPQTLLDHYLSMTDPSCAQTVDTEITKHCAYSLPAVAYTLGRRNWPCLKELYETLAQDMQWKVRRTLASSIHELAVIVGSQVTNNDLVPIFNGFLKDLDEVRIGVLKHLADFIRLLRPEIRRDYLTKIPEFLQTDNSRNWRFREELAEQLLLLTELYSCTDISEYLVPVAIALAEDKVAEVRQVAFRVLGGMLRRLGSFEDENLHLAFVNDVIERFALSKKWNRRQIYVHLCQQILEDDAIRPDRFAADMLPSLIALSTDSIPNVRISLARLVALHIMTSVYFTTSQNPHLVDVEKMFETLRTDCDRDVRYYMLQSQELEETNPLDKMPV